MFSRVGRIGWILAVSVCLLFFGFKWGPKTPEAEAMLFERLGSLWPAIPGFDRAPGRFSPPREVVFNGNKIHYSVGHVEASFKEVLDFYTQIYGVERGRLVPPHVMDKMQEVQDPDIANLVKAVRNADATFSRLAGRVRRIEGQDGGVVVIVDPGKAERDDWGQKLRDRVQRFKETGRLGELGVGKAILVHGAGPGRSTVITIWLDDDFSVRGLVGPPNHDLPGMDEPDVPRYPGSVRILSFSEKGEAWQSHTLVYESPEDLTSQRLHFQSQMKAMGWQETGFADGGPLPGGDQKGSRMMVFAKKDKECAVTMHEDSRNDNVKTIVACRRGSS
jgi:hypothetical protein